MSNLAENSNNTNCQVYKLESPSNHFPAKASVICIINQLEVRWPKKGIINNSNNGFKFCACYGKQLSEKLRKCLKPQRKETSPSSRVYENLSADCFSTAPSTLACLPRARPFFLSPTTSKRLLRRLGKIRNDFEVQNTNVLHSRVSQLDNPSTITYIISDK